MAMRTLAETAGEVLVVAFRSDGADDIFRELRVIFDVWQVDLPEDLYRQTRRPTGPLSADERHALAVRWQRVCEALLAASPDAEPILRANIQRLQGITAEAPAAPPVVPKSQPSDFPRPAAPPAAPEPHPAEVAAPPAAPEPASPYALPGFGGRSPVEMPPGHAPGSAENSRPEPGSHDPVSRAIQSAVRPGLLAFNPPAEMTQGRAERVEVGIARSAELMDAVVAGLRGRGPVHIEQVPTSAFMSAELRGDSFVIKELSPVEQIVAPSARWEFDVTPRHAGVQKLTLCVSMRFAETGPLAVPGSRIAVPVVERQVRIRVSVGYGTRVFVGQNWQWLVGTAVAVAGALAAVLAVVH